MKIPRFFIVARGSLKQQSRWKTAGSGWKIIPSESLRDFWHEKLFAEGEKKWKNDEKDMKKFKNHFAEAFLNSNTEARWCSFSWACKAVKNEMEMKIDTFFHGKMSLCIYLRDTAQNKAWKFSLIIAFVVTRLKWMWTLK